MGGSAAFSSLRMGGLMGATGAQQGLSGCFALLQQRLWGPVTRGLGSSPGTPFCRGAVPVLSLRGLGSRFGPAPPSLRAQGDPLEVWGDTVPSSSQARRSVFRVALEGLLCPGLLEGRQPQELASPLGGEPGVPWRAAPPTFGSGASQSGKGSQAVEISSVEQPPWLGQGWWKGVAAVGVSPGEALSSCGKADPGEVPGEEGKQVRGNAP